MNLKKILTIGITAALVFSSGIVTAYANTNTDQQQIKSKSYTISAEDLTQSSINILGKSEKLFVEFTDPDEALNEINEYQFEFIDKISKSYNIDKLNKDNWEDFRTAFYSYVSDNNILESSDEYYSMVCFFDIYENKDKNDQIKKLVNDNLLSIPFSLTFNSENIDSDSAVNELYNLLPSYSSLVENKNAKILAANTAVQPDTAEINAVVRSFDTTKGIAYAEKYATSKNTPKYHYFSNGDCANFTSQILEAGGVKQVVYSDVAKGWWHTSKTTLGITTHKHSQAWSMADTFARYMGVSNKTKTHKTFAANLKAGDFITCDFKSDGDWDHMAFVTKRDSSAGSYGYIDYKVAQHTSNYYAWTSSSTNGWETYSGKGTYAIVRR